LAFLFKRTQTNLYEESYPERVFHYLKKNDIPSGLGETKINVGPNT